MKGRSTRGLLFRVLCSLVLVEFVSPCPLLSPPPLPQFGRSDKLIGMRSEEKPTLGRGPVVFVAGDVEGALHTPSVNFVGCGRQGTWHDAATARKMASSPLLFVKLQHQLALCLLHGVFVVCFLRSQ